MKFVFSTVCCPQWDLATVLTRAKEYGYDGIEIAVGASSQLMAALTADSASARDQFAQSQLAVACVATEIQMTGNAREDDRLAGQIKQYVDLAQQLGCRLVKTLDAQVSPGQNPAAVGTALAGWLAPLSDYAAERQVTLVVENALSFRLAREMWGVLESLCYPAIAACWDVFHAAVAGEGPIVSVPTLNSRIQHVHVKDTRFTPQGAAYCKLGEGELDLKTLLTRLRGIGYDGWISFELEPAWQKVAPPEESLPDAIQKLKQWTAPPAPEAKPAPAKPAAKPAPKPVPAAPQA